MTQLQPISSGRHTLDLIADIAEHALAATEERFREMVG